MKLDFRNPGWRNSAELTLRGRSDRFVRDVLAFARALGHRVQAGRTGDDTLDWRKLFWARRRSGGAAAMSKLCVVPNSWTVRFRNNLYGLRAIIVSSHQHSHDYVSTNFVTFDSGKLHNVQRRFPTWNARLLLPLAIGSS